jgi:hypothetical protein
MNWLILPFFYWFLTFVILVTFFSWIFFTQFRCCIFLFFFNFRYWLCFLFLWLFSFVYLWIWNKSRNIKFHNFFLSFFQFLYFWLIILNKDIVILYHVLSMFHYFIEKNNFLNSLTSNIHYHFKNCLSTFCILCVIKASYKFTFLHYVIINIIQPWNSSHISPGS